MSIPRHNYLADELDTHRRLSPRGASFGQEVHSFLFQNKLLNRLATALTPRSHASLDELVVFLSTSTESEKKKLFELKFDFFSDML